MHDKRFELAMLAVVFINAVSSGFSLRFGLRSCRHPVGVGVNISAIIGSYSTSTGFRPVLLTSSSQQESCGQVLILAELRFEYEPDEGQPGSWNISWWQAQRSAPVEKDRLEAVAS